MNRVDQLVREYRPLAERMAHHHWHKYKGFENVRCEADYDAIRSDALFGLLKAAKRWEPERGSFLTYAWPTILGEISRGRRDRSALPRDQYYYEQYHPNGNTPQVFEPRSLDAKLERESDFTLLDTLEAPLQVKHSWLREAIGKLPSRQQVVIYLYHLWGLTQDEIAPLFGVSQMQISRLNAAALATLRESLDISEVLGY